MPLDLSPRGRDDHELESLNHPTGSFASTKPLFNDPSSMADAPNEDAPISVLLSNSAAQESKESDTATPQSRISRSMLDRMNNCWALEWLSCIMAIMCQLAILFVARKYNHQPLPNWPNFLSINSLISILGTACKAQMLLSIASSVGQLRWSWFRKHHNLVDLDTFDQASRGTIGSLRLLITLPFGHIGMLGAIITVCAIVMGPFNQQAIQYYPCSQVMPYANASLSRARAYSPPDLYSYYAPNILNSPMKGAIYSGLFSPTSNTTPVFFTCASGNCSFAHPYTTWEVCSSCRNSVYQINTTFGNFTEWNLNTEFLEYNNISFNHSFSTTLYNSISLFQPSETIGDISWNAMRTNPNGARVNYTRNSTGNLQFANISVISFSNINCTTDWFKTSTKNPDTDCIVPEDMYSSADLDAASSNYRPTWIQPYWEYYNVIAADCDLSYCLQTYNATVSDGVLVEKPLDTKMVYVGRWDEHYNNASRLFYMLAYIAVPCYVNGNPLGMDKIVRLNDTGPDRTLVHDPYSYEYGNWGVVTQCMYSLPDHHYDAIKGFFSGEAMHHPPGVFSGWIRKPGRGYNFNSISAKPGDTLNFEPDYISPFWNNGSASFLHTQEVFRNIARSMTVHLRQSGTNSTPALGTVHIMQTCMKVTWFWMILPCALTVLSGVFLVIVVALHGTHSDEPLWKTRTLALLATGFDEATRREFDAVRTAGNLEDLAKKLRVRYSRSDNGWVWTKE